MSDPRSVICPECRALRGITCMTETGQLVPIHAARVELASRIDAHSLRAAELYDAQNLIVNCLNRRTEDEILAIAAYIRAMDQWSIPPTGHHGDIDKSETTSPITT